MEATPACPSSRRAVQNALDACQSTLSSDEQHGHVYTGQQGWMTDTVLRAKTQRQKRTLTHAHICRHV